MGEADEVIETEALQTVELIRAETGLDAKAVDGGDDGWYVELDLPVVGSECRATIYVNEADDWPWLYETHVRPRLSPPGEEEV